jgi:hypothetical protein
LIFSTWWPLAASWLMMGFELPAVSAVIARLVDPQIHLAAYGGIVFPLSLFIESPIIMILSASTALSKDWDSYRRLRRFMVASAAALGAVHVVIAVTPLYDLVVGDLIGAPEEIRGPGRIGMILMTPWTPAIAYRRFQQGVLIRFGRSRVVGVGTMVRLGTNALVLAIGYAIGSMPGIVVGTAAVSAGVMAEAAFVGWRVRPIVRGELRSAPPVQPSLSFRGLLAFYIPLAVTPLFVHAAVPVVSAAISRLPSAVDSLAVWPVLNGLVFTLRSLGFAFNEVVVVLLDRPGMQRELTRFATRLAAGVTLALLVVAATPVGRFWFGTISALPPALTALAGKGLWLALLLPGLAVVQSLFQGQLVHARRTHAVTEAVLIYLAVTASLLAVAVAHGEIVGILCGIASITVGGASQVAWLRRRSRGSPRRPAVTRPAGRSRIAGVTAGAIAVTFAFFAIPSNRAIRESVVTTWKEFPNDWRQYRARGSSEEILRSTFGINYDIPHYLRASVGPDDLVLLPPQAYLLRFLAADDTRWAEPRFIYYIAGAVPSLPWSEENLERATQAVVLYVQDGEPFLRLRTLDAPEARGEIRREYGLDR